MPFHALIPSLLGPILLEADEVGLRGLYFTDQRDLPQVPGVEAVAAKVSDPTAGRQGGRPIRSFRAVRGQAAGESGALFTESTEALQMETVPLRLLQENTPDSARAVLEQTRRELDEYWRGERQVFEMPLAPQGTAFQQKVWQALLAVSCGQTLSYGELAERAGLGAGHGRAVGTAVGSNPISIIIPCHRILARNGTLNGYGGGLSRKARLLEIEGFTIR
jgi:methylated-DNA-[protein]-cysteine S-methyltransferase